MDPKQFRVFLWAPVILGVFLFLGLWTLGRSLEQRGVNDVITVTGSVKKLVTADLARWDVQLQRTATLTDVKPTIDQVALLSGAVKKFVTDHGIDEKSVNLPPVQTDPTYEQLPNYGQTQKVIGYTIRQEIEVKSSEVEKVEKLAKEANQLASQGIVFSYQTTEYYYTKLSLDRPELFADATKDARERADAIARGSGINIGAPRSARTGVIQVLKPNSTDVSDYGSYDLSTKEKEITAVVTVSFEVR